MIIADHFNRNGQLGLLMRDDGRLELMACNFGDVQSPGIDTGRWTTVVAIADGNEKQLKLFIDGKQVAAKHVPDIRTFSLNSYRIGNWLSGSNETRELKGLFDEVFIYSRVLSDEEIARLFQ